MATNTNSQVSCWRRWVVVEAPLTWDTVMFVRRWQSQVEKGETPTCNQHSQQGAAERPQAG